MAGHNRWSKVKRIKGPADAKRGKLFTKLIKEISVAAKTGGGSPDGNPRLRTALQAAKAASMPKENIERAIKKGTGELEGDAIEELLYEGYGPGGVAIIVETHTDNKNRTVGELRTLFKSNGGSLAESGSVSWMFDKIGQLFFDKSKYQEDNLIEVALQAGAKDVASGHDGFEVTTETSEVFHVKEAFERVGMHPETSGFGFIPKSVVPIDKSTAEKLFALLSEIEDHEDVQKVHANFELPEREMAEIIENQK
jgi:YebC/PmpR family DNA-binding regulatory protein